MKKVVFLFLVVASMNVGLGQQRLVDSLKRQRLPGNDTMELVLSWHLHEAYSEVNKDSSLYYANRYLALSRQLEYDLNQVDALGILVQKLEGNGAKDLDMLVEAGQILEAKASRKMLPSSYLEKLRIPETLHSFDKYTKYVEGMLAFQFAILYWSTGKYNQSLQYGLKSLDLANKINEDNELLIWSNLVLGMLIEDSDSSLQYLSNSREAALRSGNTRALGVIYDFTAKEYAFKKEFDQQLHYLRASLQQNLLNEMNATAGWSYLGLGEFYMRSVVNTDSALFYIRHAFETAVQTNNTGIRYWSSKDLYDLYKKLDNKDSAFKYVEVMLEAREKVFSEDMTMQFDAADYNRQVQQIAIEKAQDRIRVKVRLYGFLAGMAILLLIVFILWRHSQRRKKAFMVLQEQKAKTEEALRELKSTQQQLVQSEKMASLGELTAGIAHEIQNPLNFVNNFSDVNKELLAEMKDELSKGNIADATALANDVIDNEEKINHHGKRAEDIVKGMLQHSRRTTGLKEATDINKLVDEYLRLAYRGFRAKDKSFNAVLETDFDERIGNISIIPQDIGRVVLNLINNAFYAVTERKKQSGAEYEPTVWVSTKRSNDRIEIRVKDNGFGIPRQIVDKVFQPFFTTKPTGQGTGLGLSLSYDIVKSHGGELKVETKEGEGSVFIIQLQLV